MTFLFCFVSRRDERHDFIFNTPFTHLTILQFHIESQYSVFKIISGLADQLLVKKEVTKGFDHSP